MWGVFQRFSAFNDRAQRFEIRFLLGDWDFFPSSSSSWQTCEIFFSLSNGNGKRITRVFSFVISDWSGWYKDSVRKEDRTTSERCCSEENERRPRENSSTTSGQLTKGQGELRRVTPVVHLALVKIVYNLNLKMEFCCSFGFLVMHHCYALLFSFRPILASARSCWTVSMSGRLRQVLQYFCVRVILVRADCNTRNPM